jgi:hypothetical protein
MEVPQQIFISGRRVFALVVGAWCLLKSRQKLSFDHVPLSRSGRASAHASKKLSAQTSACLQGIKQSRRNSWGSACDIHTTQAMPSEFLKIQRQATTLKRGTPQIFFSRKLEECDWTEMERAGSVTIGLDQKCGSQGEKA